MKWARESGCKIECLQKIKYFNYQGNKNKDLLKKERYLYLVRCKNNNNNWTLMLNTNSICQSKNRLNPYHYFYCNSFILTIIKKEYM